MQNVVVSDRNNSAGINALSFTAHHWILYGEQASRIFLSTALLMVH
jgi:hypothetical protein